MKDKPIRSGRARKIAQEPGERPTDLHEVRGLHVPEGHLTIAQHFSGGKRASFSIFSPGGTAETGPRIGPQSSLRDLGHNGPPLAPPLKRWAIVNRPWRDYAARLSFWKTRKPAEPQSVLWSLPETMHTSPPHSANRRDALRNPFGEKSVCSWVGYGLYPLDLCVPPEGGKGRVPPRSCHGGAARKDQESPTE